MSLLAKVWPRMLTKTLLKEKKNLKQAPHNSCHFVPCDFSESNFFFASITYNSPSRIRYYSHAQSSETVLGFSAQVRICPQSSVSGYYHYQLLQGTWHDFTGGQGGYFLPFQSMCRKNTKISGHDQCAGTVCSSCYREVPLLPPVTNFLRLL